jgi:CBS domain-containing protein
VGIVSVSNLIGQLSGVKVRDRMSHPVASIGPNATLEEAAKRMAESDHHHLVVCEPSGDVVGFVSVLDVLRAASGMAERHPSGAGFYDPDQALDWSADAWLDAKHVASALDGPGVFVLLNGEPGAASASIVWAEAAANVRERLGEILKNPPTRVAWQLPGGPLTFRAAPVVGPSRRRQAFGAILARVAG